MNMPTYKQQTDTESLRLQICQAYENGDEALALALTQVMDALQLEVFRQNCPMAAVHQ